MFVLWEYCDHDPDPVILFVRVTSLTLESVEQEDEEGEDDSVVCNGTSTSGVHADRDMNGEPDSG